MKTYKICKNHLAIILLSFLFSCFSPPNEFIAPIYDLEVAFPITDTLITINDFIENDSNIVASDDPDRLGVLVYRKDEKIDAFYVNENLKLESFSTHSSGSIGKIKLNDIPEVSTNIAISDWAPVTSGTDVVFPEASSPISSDFELISEFESATFNSGNLTLSIYNNLPVTVELRELQILNNSDRTVVAKSETGSTVVIQPFGTKSVDFNLNNVKVTNSLEIVGSLYSEGSGNQVVTIPQNAGTQITAKISNLDIKSAYAKIPEQEPFTIEDSFSIDDSTKIEIARFESGNFKITSNNYSNLDLTVNLELTNLYDANDVVYKKSFKLLKNERNKVIQVPSLANWEIRTSTSGLPTNNLKYFASITANETTDLVTINSTDSVSFLVDFSDVPISYIEGIVKPTTFKIAETKVEFDLGELEDKADFESAKIEAPLLLLNLNSSVNYSMLLNGIITASSDKVTKQLKIELYLPARTNNTIDLNEFGFTDFVNSFASIGELPNKFVFSGSGTVNPNYVVGSIENGDSVSGKFAFEIPLDLGIASGSYKDTLHIDSFDIDDNTIESVNSIDLTLETINKIPVNLIVSGFILDIDNNVLFPFPPSYNEESSILIEAPEIDENGNVISAKTSKQVITLIGEDARTFINNPNIKMNFKLDTPPISELISVKFRSNDSIQFKIYGKVNYKFNN